MKLYPAISLIFMFMYLTLNGSLIPGKPRLSSFPYISGDTFRAYSDLIFEDTTKPYDSGQVTIGSIIYNECKSYHLFEEYSKKSLKFDSKSCTSLWNSFKDERNIKATIKRLIEMAEIDTENDKSIFRNAIIQDKISPPSLQYIKNAFDAVY